MARKKLSRNAPCPCGSGKKYKNCCYGKGVEDDLAMTSAQQQPQYPIGTVAMYGPDDKTTTKIAAGVILHDGDEPIMMRWVATDVTTNPKVQQELKDFFLQHGVKQVAMSQGNLGCPHEEGEDFPHGEDWQALPRLKGYPSVVEAIEESLDCGDFFNHVLAQAARAVGPGPRPAVVRPAGGPQLN